MALDLEKIDLGSFGSSDKLESTLKDNQLNASINEAVKIDPDQRAKTTELSRRSGVPEFAVENDPAAVEGRLKLDAIDTASMSKRNPNTAKYLTDFNNAAIAHDDIDVLKEIEDIFDFGETFSNIGETIRSGFKSQVAGLNMAGIDMTPSRIHDLVPAAVMPIGMEGDAALISQELASNLDIHTDEQLQQAKHDATEQMLNTLREQQEKRKSLTPEDLNLLEQGVRAGVESLANMAPGFGLMLLSGGRAAPLLATMGVQTFGDSYAQGRADGLDPERAGWFASINAAIEVGTEVLPTGTLERILTGKSEGLSKAALKFMVQEMGTEQLATLGQTLNENAFGIDEQMAAAESVEEMVQLQLQRQAVTAIATVVAGGAQVTAVTGIRKTVEALSQDRSAKETQGQVEQRKLDQINSAAEKSKLKNRSKEAFQQFVEQADGDNNTHVFIDGAQTALYLQTKTVEEIQADPALTRLRQGVDEAASLGGQLSIPVAEFATEMAGTEHFTQLRDSMTLSDQTIAPFRQEQVQQETQGYIRTLLDEAQENVSQYVEAQELYTRVRDQLLDSGQVNAQNASVMAQVVPAWATAQARRQGKSVEQVYQDAGLLIEGPQTGEKARLQGEFDLLGQTPVATDVIEQGVEFSPENPEYPLAPRGDWFGDANFAQRGGKVVMMDPLAIFEGGKEDGRHRARAAINLGIEQVPVILFGEQVERFEQSAPEQPRNLFVAHNLSAENILAAADLGGLAAPSIAVTRADLGEFSDFGEVTLLADPTLLTRSGIRTFEAKAQRAVSFDEFDTAVVPKGMRKEALQVLRDAGLKIKTYDPTGKGKTRQQVIAEQKKLLFQPTSEAAPGARGYYDPTNSIIRLTEAADLSTFLHEFAHFMYEMELKGDTDLLQSINGWYKRNADALAAEANGYLDREGGALEQAAADPLADFDPDKNYVSWGVEQDPVFDSEGNETEGEPYVKIDYVVIDESNRGRGLARAALHYELQQIKKEHPDLEVKIIADPMEESVDRDQLVEFYESMGFDATDEDVGAGVLLSMPASSIIQSPEELAQSTPPTGRPGTITAGDVVAFLDQTTTGDRAKDAAIRRAVHEQFARGFETYLMEGKAPSIELRNAFLTFARWLSQIYQNLRGQLNVNLDAGMRQVFDRLLATEEQIVAAEARARVAPLFTDAVMAGMTEEEFADYQQRQSKVKDVQHETLRDKLIKQLTRQQEEWWKEEKRDLADEEIDRLKKERVYVARDQLRTGDIKLDFATVKEMVGEERTDKRGRTSIRVSEKLRGMTAKEHQGLHPDEAAAILGYDSGSQMLDDLISAPSITEAADAAAEARMVERHGDIMTDGSIEQAADEAVQNEERGKLLLHELKMLARGTNAPTADRATIKAIAAERIGQMSFRQIHPGKYRSAEIKAANEAGRMLAEGNREGAAAAKMRQVLNYYLGMEATRAKNETTAIVDRMSRYGKKKVQTEIMKSEGGHWEQIVKILNRFEFRKSATLTEVENINTWARERMETEGDGLVLTPVVLNESLVTHWKNVPFGDLVGVSASVKNIEHVARYSNKMNTMAEELEFKKLKADWIASIKKNKQRFETKATRSRAADARETAPMEHVRRWSSQLTKIPFLASWLDGGERAGLSHQILIQLPTDALDAKMNLIDTVATPVNDAIIDRSKEDKKRHMRKIWIPEINDHLLGHQVLAVALNTGNQSNLRKLLLGEGWADPENDADISLQNAKLQAVLQHMTASDWQLVQTIWDQMEILYPQLAEVHRRTTGLVPPKVEATPVETPFGTFKGGYYPVKYSPQRSHKAEKNAEKRDAETESMFNNTASIQASVNAGATNERTGFYDRIHLSLDVVPEHFNEVIHYITHHDAVRQINRLIQAPDVADAISGVLGESEFKQLKPWLNDVAKDGRGQPVKTFIDEAFQRLRFGTTLGVMGFKASTGIMQVFGLFTTAAELGVGPTVKGIQSAVGRAWYMKAIRRTLGSTDDLQSGWDFAAERSKVLPHRTETMDREIRNAMTRLKGQRGFIAATQEVSMKHIALIQTYMVDLPTWLAAYDKTLSETGDEQRAIQTADLMVESLQGSGATKDMAAIVRNQSKLLTTFTMFMTFFSSLGNLSRDLVKGTRSGRYSVTSVAAKLMFLYTIPVFLEMLMRGELDEPEDEDGRLGKYLTELALYPLASVPVVRDVASGLIGDYGYNSTPVASMLERGIAGTKGIATALMTDEEITRAQVKNATKLAGAIIGIPGTGQIWATGEHLYDVLEEGEDFTVRESLFGPKRD